LFPRRHDNCVYNYHVYFLSSQTRMFLDIYP
jgi:hypothetical protein